MQRSKKTAKRGIWGGHTIEPGTGIVQAIYSICKNSPNTPSGVARKASKKPVQRLSTTGTSIRTKAEKPSFSAKKQGVGKSGCKPPKKLYASGRRFEYRVRNDLRRMGFVVVRSAGSKTPIDLIAISKGELWFIQCKANGVLSGTEKEKLCGLAAMVGALPRLAKKNDDKTISYEHPLDCDLDNLSNRLTRVAKEC
jgi:Holliday junction resolvase